MSNVSDDIDPEPEQRLRRILVDGLGHSRSAWLRNAITAAADEFLIYRRESNAHALVASYDLVSAAKCGIRSFRERGGYALAARQGIDVALITDELWRSSDAIGRWIEYERARLTTRLLENLAAQLETQPSALRGLIAAYQSADVAGGRVGEEVVDLARELHRLEN